MARIKQVVYVISIPMRWIARDSDAAMDMSGEISPFEGRSVFGSITVEGLLLVHV